MRPSTFHRFYGYRKGVGPGGGGGLTYDERALALDPSTLLFHLPLTELTGIVATDQGAAGRNAAIGAGITLNATTFLDGSPAPAFNVGSLDLFSASLAAAWSGGPFTFVCWLQVPDGNWPTVDQYFLQFQHEHAGKVDLR